MSGKVVGWAFDQRVGSFTTKLVLVKLADNANDDGICWPSFSTQARDTELSERSISREVKNLEAQGLIRVERRVTSRGQVSNVYHLNIPWTRSRKNAPPPATSSGGALPKGHSAPATVAGDALTVSQGHIDEPSKEPSLNPAPSVAPPITGRAERLAHAISQVQFDTWFQDADFIEGSPNRIVVRTPFVRQWVNSKFATPIRRAFGEDAVIEARQVTNAS